MPDVDYLRIIKWVLIVLLAGFIGQFGKSFAKHLMEKARAKKNASSPTVDGTPPTSGTEIREKAPDTISPEEKAKQDKKLSKTLAKQRKKATKALEKQKKS